MQMRMKVLMIVIGLFMAGVSYGQSEPSAPLISGWSMLKEGDAEGTAEIDAKHATNPNAHLIKIAITKLAPFGEGRLGVKNSAPIAVKKGASYDITFTGVSEGIGVGLVFSLETDDGKVIAGTTLPEIGRGGRGAPAGAQSSPWRRYALSVLGRVTVPNAHLTITAIEPVPVWLENVVIVERPESK
jgi:hypothetical protein